MRRMLTVCSARNVFQCSINTGRRCGGVVTAEQKRHICKATGIQLANRKADGLGFVDRGHCGCHYYRHQQSFAALASSPLTS